MRLKRIKIQMSLLTSLQATQAFHRNVDEEEHKSEQKNELSMRLFS